MGPTLYFTLNFNKRCCKRDKCETYMDVQNVLQNHQIFFYQHQ